MSRRGVTDNGRTVQSHQGVGPDASARPPRPVLLDPGKLTRCRHRVRLDQLDPTVGRDEPDQGVQQRREAAEAHRAAVRAALVAPAPDDWVIVEHAQRRADCIAQTMEAVARRVPRIWGATLPDEPEAGRRGHAEVLWWDAELGGYLPVIVVNHKVLDPGTGALLSGFERWAPRASDRFKPRAQAKDQVRLAHLVRMLEHEGIAAGHLVGGVIGADGEHLLAHDLTEAVTNYDVRLADRLAVARGTITTEPFRIGECRSCPWWPGCEQRLRERDDVSLVVSGSRGHALADAGVTTARALAEFTGPAPLPFSAKAFDELVVTARARLADIPLVRRVERPTITRADVEIDVDMESYTEAGAYLWGTLRTVDGADVYRPFVTWEPLPTHDEARSFAQFWGWLMAERSAAESAGRSFAAYCYAHQAENHWLFSSATRFAGLPGIPGTDEVQRFVDSDQWVDVYDAIGGQFITPHGKSLKTVAPVAGFHWRDPEAGGEASMRWYRRAVGLGPEFDLSQRQRILDYNEDDVRATKALREWISGPARALPLAAGRELLGS